MNPGKTLIPRLNPRRQIRPLPLALILSLLAGAGFPPATFAADTVKAARGQIMLPTYPWSAVPHPYFRGTDRVNIYPYPMLDFLSRDKANRTYRTVIVENEYLRITFLPELGGKVHEVIDKTTGQPMFYVNHVLKPALIGQCGAWTSGGIEWNTGPQGHTVGCMQPVAVEILPPAADGSRSVAIGEVERIYGTKWTVLVTLRPGRSFIEERIRIYNPTETIRPYYFWNCTAVSNTKGFRFIYPMTLGTDHGGETFFQWPIDKGKDLSRGTNYQDASSIFAYGCDQDFFGSYNDDLDRGIVSYANHRQLPGKKAWTWGWGSYGTMHQMDLTDDDGPYNEVQTGPLLTQGEVGRLDPNEAISWQEWWYPIHGMGGFTYANRDLAVNATLEGGKLRLQMLGSGTFKGVEAQVVKNLRLLASARCSISPHKVTELTLDLAGAQEPFSVHLSASKAILAGFRVPLDLPVRKPPEKKRAPQTAAELAQAGWQDFLFARFPEAEAHFQKALEQDANCTEAHLGLAYTKLDSDPAAASSAAQAAINVNPDNGKAHFALAVAKQRLGDDRAALDEAWKAALDPATVVSGRALAAKLLARQGDLDGAVNTLSAPGPWQTDTVCRNRLAEALLMNGQRDLSATLARQNLEVDPLDPFALGVLWFGGSEAHGNALHRWLESQPLAGLDLAADFLALGEELSALRITENWMRASSGNPSPPLAHYWAAYLEHLIDKPAEAEKHLRLARERASGGSLELAQAWPCRLDVLPALRWACDRTPGNGYTALCLGHLLFHLGRHAEAREMWMRAADCGAAPAITFRALGMAALTIDQDPDTAVKHLTRAHKVDPTDAIVARDLARVLFTLADKSDSAERKRELTLHARDTLKAAFDAGKGRSDFIALLARAQNRLGEHAETARLLDSVRITIWEGAREAHDLFEEAHLILGEAHVKAGRHSEALTEFNRALEYPANLATGRLEHTREAHIHYLRGNALAALGQPTAAREAWKKAADEPPSSDAKKESARQKAKEALNAVQP